MPCRKKAFALLVKRTRYGYIVTALLTFCLTGIAHNFGISKFTIILPNQKSCLLSLYPVMSGYLAKFVYVVITFFGTLENGGISGLYDLTIGILAQLHFSKI